MFIEGTVYNMKVNINTDKIDYFYNDEGKTKVVIGETLFLVLFTILELENIIKG